MPKINIAGYDEKICASNRINDCDIPFLFFVELLYIRKNQIYDFSAMTKSQSTLCHIMNTHVIKTDIVLLKFICRNIFFSYNRNYRDCRKKFN